jgi:protein O-GlcNAc transferase
LRDCEALALRLAAEPAALPSIKAKLSTKRASLPLFDSARVARHLEAAYTAMWKRHRRGEPPAGFSVDAIAAA